MSEKKYKRIGWVVETRVGKNLPWIRYIYTVGTYKKDVIHRFEFVNDHLKFRRMEQRGFARLEPVYVEVQDAKA